MASYANNTHTAGGVKRETIGEYTVEYGSQGYMTNNAAQVLTGLQAHWLMTTMLRPGQRMVHLPGIGITTSPPGRLRNWLTGGRLAALRAALRRISRRAQPVCGVVCPISPIPGTYDAALRQNCADVDASNGMDIDGSTTIPDDRQPQALVMLVWLCITGATVSRRSGRQTHWHFAHHTKMVC